MVQQQQPIQGLEVAVSCDMFSQGSFNSVDAAGHINWRTLSYPSTCLLGGGYPNNALSGNGGSGIVVIKPLVYATRQPTQIGQTYSPTTPTGAPTSPTVAPSSQPTMQPPVPLATSMQVALATGSSANVTVSDLVLALSNVTQRCISTYNTITTIPFASYPTTISARRSRRALQSVGYTNISMSWDPTHDSVFFQVSDPIWSAPLLRVNSPDTATGALAIAGTALAGKGGKFAAFGTNPLHDLAKYPGRNGGAGDSGFNQSIANVARWLLQNNDLSSLGINVVVAHIPGNNYWFDHDDSTIRWVKQNLPSAQVNAINACDNQALPGCLANAQLLVIGRQMGTEDDSSANSPTTDPQFVANAVRNYSSHGGAVLYVHYYKGSNDLATALFSQVLKIDTRTNDNNDNYKLVNYNLASVAGPIPSTTAFSRISNLVDGVFNPSSPNALNSSDLYPCLTSEGSTWNNCQQPGFVTKVKDNCNWLQSAVGNFDQSGIDLFGPTDESLLFKLAVLLGDKARDKIQYRCNYTDINQFSLKMYGETSMLLRRKLTPAQPDGGSLYCSVKYMVQSDPNLCASLKLDYQTWINDEPVYSNQTITQPTFQNDEWTTTGLFGLPGKPFNVTRLDNATSLTIKIYFWFQRQGTSKSLSGLRDDGLSSYFRPQMARTQGVLVKPGETVTITHPIGGPVYLGLQGANSGAATAILQFDGVAKHAALLDMGSNSSIEYFLAKLNQTHLPCMDMRALGLEVHSMRNNWEEGIAAYISQFAQYGFGIRNFVDDYRFRFVEKQYTLAGFKAPGKTLNQTLPASVQQLCTAMNWPCWDESIHSRASTQHSNYDDWANCGDGCSGNPWDADWGVTAIGWGESHELGHNMQIRQTTIGYSSNADDRNNWSNLGTTSTGKTWNDTNDSIYQSINNRHS